MEVNDNKVMAILFERKVLKQTDSSAVYSYIPLDIVRGKEMNFSGCKVLTIPNKELHILNGVPNENYDEDNKQYEFSNIEDTATLDDKYVYGFPLILKKNFEQNKANIETMKRDLETIQHIPIVQLYDDNNDLSRLFININGCNLNIKADNYFELADLLYSGIYSIRDDLNELIENAHLTNFYIPNSSFIYSSDIYNKVSKTVICQDEAIKQIATVIAKNSRITNTALKSNLLICGPTGVGKTEIFRSISENFKIPIALEDANEYTAASYKGKDVEEILFHLIQAAGGDVERAQYGIVVIDEIDKKVSKTGEHETFTSAVLNAFLKMMEGHVYKLQTSKGVISFDTSHITFVFTGAFSGIEELSGKKLPLGFVSPQQIAESLRKENIYNDETLKKFGLLPEFIGRCDTIVPLNSLGIDELAQIIKTSNKSQLLLYKYLFENMGIDFIYDDRTILAIAKKANEIGLGARSIKKIVENAFKIINYNVFSRNHYSKLIISPETIEDNKQFILK